MRRRQNSLTVLPLCLAIYLGGFQSAWAESNLTPGQQFSVTISGVPGPTLIYLPSNFTPNKKWPVIFFYHGSNGKPDTHVMRRFTGGKNYIVVGMEYIERGSIRRTPAESRAYEAKEVKSFLRTATYLKTHVKADIARWVRILVTGWHSAFPHPTNRARNVERPRPLR